MAARRNFSATAFGLDLGLIYYCGLCFQLLRRLFMADIGPAGMPLTPEEIIPELPFLTLFGLAAAIALTLQLIRGDICSLGCWMLEKHAKTELSPWHLPRTWILLVLLELTFFAGWMITEVNLGAFVANFGKAFGIISGLLHPSGSVFVEGLILLVQTLFLAFMATIFAVPIAFLLSFIASQNLMKQSRVGTTVYYLTRTVLNLFRSIEPLVWALIFISWVGIGPFAGVLSLWIHSVAALAKLYSEQVEAIDRGPLEAILATGANSIQVVRFGVIPQVIVPFLGFTIYRWDINVRMSTIIGFVGGGGIGYILKPRVDLGEWPEVGTLILLIAGAVWLMDIISAQFRSRIQ